MKCLYCQQEFSENISLKELIVLSPIQPKEMCSACKGRFTLNNKQPKCLGCDKTLVTKKCADCQVWQKHYPGRVIRHESLYCYDEALHDWFQQYKFKGNLTLAGCFSQEVGAYFRAYSMWLIVPIPLSEVGLRSRGFNQVEALLTAAGITYEAVLKKRVGEELPQSSKTRVGRLQTEQNFYLSGLNSAQIKGRKILIVDDVYTTGRTLMHARDALEVANPLEVKTFSLAR